MPATSAGIPSGSKAILAKSASIVVASNTFRPGTLTDQPPQASYAKVASRSGSILHPIKSPSGE
jgi:hypothetical protein